MASDLEDLRARSKALDERLADDEALEVNAAILALVPADPVATNRLGAGLIAVGRAKDAIDVYAAGLETHPKNEIMRGRLTQAQHAAMLDKAAASGKQRTRRSATTGWIKSIYGDDTWTVAPGEETWISDAGQLDADGNRMYRNDGVAWGEPSWNPGDPVGLYFGGTYKVPVLVAVAGAPYFDPPFVARERNSPERGERWPWVTPVRGIAAVPLADAPTLSDLGIDHGSMQQRARLMLDDARRTRLLAAFGRTSA
jgi:hypothetical protein